jgi:hypothetical protein
LLADGCDKPNSPAATPASGLAAKPEGRLEQLLRSNATLTGYLYTPDKPYIIASFSNGSLIWRSDPERQASTQGQVQVFNEPDRTCVGFERKNLLMPNHGLERYLVCEALQTIQHSNSLPRSQDFALRPGTVFVEYRPPAGTGFPQIFYASVK